VTGRRHAVIVTKFSTGKKIVFGCYDTEREAERNAAGLRAIIPATIEVVASRSDLAAGSNYRARRKAAR
jgi:hypothetical protein